MANVVMGSKLFNGRIKKLAVLFLVLAVLLSCVPTSLSFRGEVHAAGTTLQLYPAPSGATLQADYTVKVRVAGGSWQDLDEYRAVVGIPSKTSVSFVYFDTDGPVEMSVTYNIGTLQSAKIRGLNQTITPTISGNTMTFTMAGPMKLSVEVNGNVNNHLMIFANPLEVNPPSANDPNVIYLGPGIYNTLYCWWSNRSWRYKLG
jgi:hypothetical protein